MSIASTILAEISTHDLQNVDHIDHIDHTDLGHIDHVDHADLGHIDHVDYIDHADLGHIDHVDHIDHTDLGHIDHVDHIDHTDLGHIDNADHIDHTDLGHVDHADHIDHAISDTTPAPFMLLFSTSLLFFGISGILFYYLFDYQVRFLLFFATLAVTFLFTKLISTTWKKIAKSRFYNISSTQNLIGQKGLIVLDVDKRGGVIKIPSNNPMKFERIHVKPLNPDSSFEKGEEVYICDIKDGFLLVDNKVNSIQYRIRQKW
ncbi:MAG: NfeD family protein [Candidatus Thorarchaeota archaeon]